MRELIVSYVFFSDRGVSLLEGIRMEQRCVFPLGENMKHTNIEGCYRLVCACVYTI